MHVALCYWEITQIVKNGQPLIHRLDLSHLIYNPTKYYQKIEKELKVIECIRIFAYNIHSRELNQNKIKESSHSCTRQNVYK